jgi:hypothetical protein
MQIQRVAIVGPLLNALDVLKDPHVPPLRPRATTTGRRFQLAQKVTTHPLND